MRSIWNWQLKNRALICFWIERRLWDYAAGKLAVAAQRRIDQHLNRCAGCRERLRETKMVTGMIESVKQRTLPLSESGWSDIRLRVIQQQSSHNRSMPMGLQLAAIAIAFGLLALCVVRQQRAAYMPTSLPATQNVAVSEPSRRRGKLDAEARNVADIQKPQLHGFATRSFRRERQQYFRELHSDAHFARRSSRSHPLLLAYKGQHHRTRISLSLRPLSRERRRPGPEWNSLTKRIAGMSDDLGAMEVTVIIPTTRGADTLLETEESDVPASGYVMPLINQNDATERSYIMGVIGTEGQLNGTSRGNAGSVGREGGKAL